MKISYLKIQRDGSITINEKLDSDMLNKISHPLLEVCKGFGVEGVVYFDEDIVICDLKVTADCIVKCVNTLKPIEHTINFNYNTIYTFEDDCSADYDKLIKTNEYDITEDVINDFYAHIPDLKAGDVEVLSGKY
jgi:uncharacterized metal-binding protein YceD (DUF177 family)